MLKELKGLADKFEVALDSVNDNLQTFKKQDIWGKVGKIGENMVDITNSLNKPDELSQIVENILDFSVMIKDTWKTIDLSAQNINEITGHGKFLINNVREGRGLA